MMKKSGAEKIVLVFGVFDGLHDGHRHFLREARKLGERLVVAVAHDEVVKELKGHAPRQSAAARAVAILQENLADETTIGDETIGRFTAVKTFKPDIIAVGYDQEDLQEKLGKMKELDATFSALEVVMVSSHRPNELHTRLITK